MAALVAAIHDLFVEQQTWMAGTSPGMTAQWHSVIARQTIVAGGWSPPAAEGSRSRLVLAFARFAPAGAGGTPPGPRGQCSGRPAYRPESLGLRPFPGDASHQQPP